MKMKTIFFSAAVVGASMLLTACTEDYLDTTPAEFIEEEAVQEVMKADPAQVQAFVIGAYEELYGYYTNHDDAGLPALRLALDLTTDDVAYPNDIAYFNYDYQLDNRLTNYRRTASTWRMFYSVIDKVNTVITMLKPAEGETPTESSKTMLGEAYALRAYSYFYLINLYQHPYSKGTDKPGVPLKTDTEYRTERVPVGDIYDQILSDIELGYNYLKGAGFHTGKTGLSEYAAAAIYANILLFTGDHAKAASYAEIAAKAAPLNSEADMLSGFNSLTMPEIIWGYGVTTETSYIVASFFSHVCSYAAGYSGALNARKQIASDLYDRIADNDIRKQWFGYKKEFDRRGANFTFEKGNEFMDYVQSKYVDISMANGGVAFNSDIFYLRSGEMYFVAAEAYYLANNTPKATEMLNTVMATRIPGYNFTETGSALYDEICLQKRIETFLEGSRFFDGKRRGETFDRTKSVNHSITLPAYNALTFKADEDPRMIYQITLTEMENNPEATENNP